MIIYKKKFEDGVGILMLLGSLLSLPFGTSLLLLDIIEFDRTGSIYSFISSAIAFTLGEICFFFSEYKIKFRNKK